MANQYNDAEKKLLVAVQEFSEALTTNNYSEAWQRAGYLNSLLKIKEEYTNMPKFMVEMIGVHVKNYYRQAETVNRVQKTMYGIGKKLAEFQ